MSIKMCRALSTGLLALSAIAFTAPAQAAKAVAPAGFTCIAPADLGKVAIKIGDVHFKKFVLGLSSRDTGQESVVVRLNYSVSNTGAHKRRAYFQMIGVQSGDIIDFAISEETVLSENTTAMEHETTDTIASPNWNVALALLCYRADAF